MEAVTDVVFRQVVARAGRPDLFFTEFTNAASYCSPRGIDSTKSRLQFATDEQPVIAQIWGSRPEQFAQMAVGLQQQGFSGIDINMGCPDKSVIKNGAGSALISQPQLAQDLIAATKTAGLPVSVKTRLGDSQLSDWPDWLGFLFQQNVANLTIHLRTRKEMSKVAAHYELIPAIIQLRDQIAPQTLLTINGDISDRQHGLKLVQLYPGLDGLMIGRGIFANPYAFAKDGHNDQPSNQISNKGLIQRRLDLFNYHLDLFDQYSTSNTGAKARKFEPLKRFFKIYVRDITGAAELREQLMRTHTTAEVRQLLAEFAKTIDAYGDD